MEFHSKSNSRGGILIRITLRPEEIEDYYAEFKRLANHADGAEIKEDIAKLPVVMANTVSDKDKPPRKKPKEKFKVHEFWREWYALLKKKFGIIVPLSMGKEESGLVKTLLREYHEDGTRKIFEVAILDWAAFKQLRPRVSNVPTLRDVVFYRRDLAAAAGGSGITTAKHRVSAYAQKSGKTGWEAD